MQSLQSPLLIFFISETSSDPMYELAKNYKPEGDEIFASSCARRQGHGKLYGKRFNNHPFERFSGTILLHTLYLIAFFLVWYRTVPYCSNWIQNNNRYGSVRT